MPAFQTPYDIGNRALQILGVPDRITNSFTGSKAAVELGRTYEMLRETELNSNLWRFSTRNAVLRAVSADTLAWTPAAWSSVTTYSVGNVVTYSNEWWQSKVASNLNHAPAMGAYWRRYFGPDTMLAYDADVSYYVGELVEESGDIFLSLENSNDDDPADLTGTWLDVGGTTTSLQILYPIGAGPITSNTTLNVYKLPRGYLTRAPTQPKGNAYPWLGAPRGLAREDWVLEDEYIVTASAGPLFIRFVADMVDVPNFGALFCEALAARMAEASCEAITQGTTKQALARSRYRDAIMRARQNNAIELGPVDADLDDLIAARY